VVGSVLDAAVSAWEAAEEHVHRFPREQGSYLACASDERVAIFRFCWLCNGVVGRLNWCTGTIALRRTDSDASLTTLMISIVDL
jgi:hypothetical protein